MEQGAVPAAHTASSEPQLCRDREYGVACARLGVPKRPTGVLELEVGHQRKTAEPHSIDKKTEVERVRGRERILGNTDRQKQPHEKSKRQPHLPFPCRFPHHDQQAILGG